jgi:imidazolonepropionase-like amidohydrolase
MDAFPDLLSAAPTVIKGGRLLTMAGAPIEDGMLILVDGKVAYAGESTEVPAESRVIDAQGKWILPGFIEAHAHVGIHEESVGVPGDDTNESSSPNTAGIRAQDAINIEDEGFADALRGGITTVIVKPGSSNPIAGLTVALKTWGGQSLDEQLVQADISLKSALGEGNPASFRGRALL